MTMRTSACCLVVLLLATTGRAQTSDLLWHNWSWLEDGGAARAAGLGGAYVAVADDSASAHQNPAGLAKLPQTELTVGGLYRGEGTTTAGKALKSRAGFGYVGGGTLVNKRWAVGGYLTEPLDVRGSGAWGYLDATVTEVGGSVAWMPAERIRLGLRINGTHLRLRGISTSSAGIVVGTTAGHTRITGDFGALLSLTETLDLGASWRQGATWEAERTAITKTGITLDAGSRYNVRTPNVAAVGLAYRPSPRWTLSAQLDYLRLTEIADNLPSEYTLDDAIEGRGGIEYSWPRGSVTLQARAGVHARGPRAASYQGTDPDERAHWPEEDRALLGAAGASVVTRGGERLDVAATFGGERTTIVVGMATRF